MQYSSIDLVHCEIVECRRSTFCTMSGDGLALEATLRFKRTSEEENDDTGTYLEWDAIIEKHGGDLEKAGNFARRRRSEPQGTSTSRNNGSETFLWFEAQRRSWRQKSIDTWPFFWGHICCFNLKSISNLMDPISLASQEECSTEVGANPVTAANLMRRMSQPFTPLQAPLLPPPSMQSQPGTAALGESNEDDKKKPKPKAKPKQKKEKAPAPQMHRVQGNMPCVFFGVAHPPCFGS